jgi:hypothetical protein
LTDLTITSPGKTFTDQIFTLKYEKGKHGVDTTSVVDVIVNGSAGSHTFSGNSIGDGQNFFTLTTSNGDTMSSVEIKIENGDKGFSDLEQVRISGLPVPEPSSLVLGVGGLSLCCLALLRRKTAIRKEEGRTDDIRPPLAF